jgi:predicted 3-demethylubiquinone-9 3-methyltransferase (glyoxalase superfamily)
MVTTQRITPCLWFTNEAEAAARFYTGIFKNSKITAITHYPDAGFEAHHQPAGQVMTVSFDIDGQSFTGLNGGPAFKFSEAISFQVNCATQEEIDYYWSRLSEGGDPKAQQCGWLKDKFGLSWQIVPNFVDELYKDEKSEGAKRAFAAMLQMKKLDIAKLRAAFEGK